MQDFGQASGKQLLMKYSWLCGVCLALIPLAVCPGPAPAQAPAKAPSPADAALTGPVTKINIVGLKNINLAAVQAKLTLKVGDAYTPEAAQKDAAAMRSMGVFNGQVTVAATPASPNSIDLAYTVSENPVVQSIHITANTPSGQPSVPSDELLAQMKTKIGKVLNTNSLISDLDSLFNHTNGYVTKQGYIFDVSSDINIEPKTGVLTIPLIESYVKSIQVSGNNRIKTADILAQMHTKPDALYNIKALEEDKSSIYEMGEFKQVDASLNAAGPGKLSVTISVVEQPAATGILDEKQGKVIPFLYDPPTVPFPVVQVSINGRPPLSFVVDTGTTAPLLLAPWAVKELGLSPNSKVEKASNFTFSRVPIQGVILQGANHDNAAFFNPQEALVTDWSVISIVIPQPHIAGIIGLGMLGMVTSRFDFAAKTLTIFTSPHPPLHISGGTTLPLRLNSISVFTVHATLAPNTYADLALDTGSEGTELPLSAMTALHPTATAFDSFQETVDGTVYVCPELRLPNLAFGPLRLSNVEVNTLPPSTRQSLGMDLLGGYRITLDGPNAQVTLEPSLHGGRYVGGRTGVGLEQTGKFWTVESGEKKSPAEQSGLQVGDEIVTVSGIDTEALSELQVQHLLQGITGMPLHVLIKRGQNKQHAVSWIPLSSFTAPRTTIDGLPMQKASGGPWIISEIIKGCPGDKAGLLAGDTLTKMDGEATATMSLVRFAELVRKPVVLLEVVRPGVAKPFSVRLTVPK